MWEQHFFNRFLQFMPIAIVLFNINTFIILCVCIRLYCAGRNYVLAEVKYLKYLPLNSMARKIIIYN